MSDWQSLPLGDVLERRRDEIDIQDIEIYKRITIRMNGRGIAIRDLAHGSEIGTKRQFIARSGQLILSKIDARNGAFGIVPPECDKAIITGNFWTFDTDASRIDARFLNYLTMSPLFVDFCVRASEGTTNRRYLKEPKFLAQRIDLPRLDEQRRIVTRIQEVASKIENIRTLRKEIATTQRNFLLSVYSKLIRGAKWFQMNEIAPLVRRHVAIDPLKDYFELGIRSFGKGTFHKPPILGASLGTKRVFQIEPGDLLFNIVFAWEGAVAVVRPEDQGRVGSHRFLSCVPKRESALPAFLRFHFLTERGLSDLGLASPGGAGRNRTLGVDALARMEVPVPPVERQQWFASLLAKVEESERLREIAGEELKALMPSILSKAFRGEL